LPSAISPFKELWNQIYTCFYVCPLSRNENPTTTNFLVVLNVIINSAWLWVQFQIVLILLCHLSVTHE
jgi:hypothetical protein